MRVLQLARSLSVPNSPPPSPPSPDPPLSPLNFTAPQTMQATVAQSLPPAAFNSHPTDRRQIELTHRVAWHSCILTTRLVVTRTRTFRFSPHFSPLQIAFCPLASLVVPFHVSTWPCRKPWPSTPRVVWRRPFQPRLQARCWRLPRLGLVQCPRSAVLPLKRSRFKFSHIHAILPSCPHWWIQSCPCQR